MMKKKNYYAAMATGLVFASCSSDSLIEPDKSGPAEKDQTLYVRMAIHGDISADTRAGSVNGSPVDNDVDFEVGTGESEVDHAYFVFYDADGNMVGEIVQIKLENPTTASAGNTVEKYYQNVIPVSIKKGQNNPAQVICYINPKTPAGLQNPLDVIQTITRRDVVYSSGDSQFFPMSNSVYYDSDNNNKLIIAVDVKSGMLFNTEQEAKNATDAQAIDVYVERYASKLRFNSKSASDYTTFTSEVGGEETEVVLSFNAIGWALNAEAKETYVVKSFRQESTTGAILPDTYPYSILNGNINKGLTDAQSWDWNNSSFHRSFWGMSPAYFTENYPEVSSDVMGSNLNQKYYTYQEVMDKVDGTFDADQTDPQYFRETTVGLKAIASHNPAASMPSVILVGNYTIKIGQNAPVTNEDIYSYIPSSNGNPSVFFANQSNSAESKIPGGVSMLMRFLQQTTVLFKQVNGNYIQLNTADDLNTMVATLEVAKPDPKVLETGGTAEGAMKIPARQVTLQIKEGANTAGVLVANGNGYKMIVDDNAENFNPATQIRLTDANRVIMQQVGFANKYVAGAAYFNIPVKHYGWYRPGNANRETVNGTTKDRKEIDWSKVLVGDFGMVRNHSYTITIDKIEGLATGIGGKNDPIVPPAVTKDYYVAYKVRILKWAVVPEQHVEL